MIQVVTDSTADLTPALAKQQNIKVIPLSVSIGGTTYRDGLDLDQEKLFALVKKSGELPKTAAPTIGEFHELFSQADETVFVGISSQLSATVHNALLTAQEFPEGKIRVIDSLNLSSGIASLAQIAAQLRDQGLPAAEIEAQVKKQVPNIRLIFMVDTMEYLYKGGRCTALESVLGSMLKIHPIIEMCPDGTLGMKGKASGSRKKSMKMLLDDLEAHLDVLDPSRIFIIHSSPQTDVDYFRNEIIRIAHPDEVAITLAGSVISSHCGPGTMGILYLTKPDE
jgi:DegV family protein with EDD domain